MQPESYEVAGVRITPMTIATMHELIGQAVRDKSSLSIISQNLHSLYLQYRHEALRKMHAKATYIRIDGMPLVLFAKLRGLPVQREHRTGWMDWIDPFLTTAEQNGWSIFYVGSKPDIMEKALDIITSRYPALRITGHHGYFDMSAEGDANRNVIRLISEFKPDITLIGMGMPRQEEWLLENWDSLASPVRLTCGACMDYVAGAQAVPPRWLGRIGLEWLYRLYKDPRRMWFRYLVEPWFAAKLFIKETVKIRRNQRRDV